MTCSIFASCLLPTSGHSAMRVLIHRISNISLRRCDILYLCDVPGFCTINRVGLLIWLRDSPVWGTALCNKI